MRKRTIEEERDRRIIALGRAFDAFGHEGLLPKHLIEIQENIAWLVEEVKKRRSDKLNKAQMTLKL